MTDLSRMRVSDAERENVVVRLQQATAEGRLSLDELGDRVSGAYASLTRSELDQFIDDLPPAPEPEPEQPPPAPAPASETANRALSFLILAMGAGAIPISFFSALGPALGLVAVVLGVLALSRHGETSRVNRGAIVAGVVLGLMPPVFYLSLLLMLGG